MRPPRVACAALVLALAAACGDGSGPEAPTPAITNLNPNPVLQWTENGLNLTVTGSGFEEGAVVRLSGSGQPTAYVSQSQLVAQIPEFLTHQVQTFQVSVLNPGQKGKESATVTLPVEHRAPTAHSLVPLTATQGDPGFTLTVHGTGFAQGAAVRWNGTALPTTFVSQWTLTALVSAANLEQPGAVQVTVFNPTPGGGEAAPQTFQVAVRPNPIPVVSAVSPQQVTLWTDTEITLTGAGFMTGSQVVVGQAMPATTVVSPTQLRFVLSASSVTASGSFTFVVVNPPPGGGSTAVNVTVLNPVPVLSALSPASAVIGNQALTVRLTGTGFTENAWVTVDGSFAEITQRDGSTGLEILLPARDVDEPGALSIRVLNPAPGGGASDPISFPLLNPAPVIQSLSPSEMGASPHWINLRVRITGTGFLSSTVVRVNGDPRPTEYISPTEIEVLLSGQDLDEPGVLTLVAVNPQPGGGSSPPVTFTVTEPPPLPPAGPP